MKRGMILAAVMLLVALGALTSVGVLFRSNAEQFTVSASGRSARVRAMARSGLAGVVREFESQRMEILRGGDPVLIEEYSLEQADGRTAVARVVRVRNAAAVAESAKLNVNHSSEETLARLSIVGPDLAKSMVVGRPYAAVDELLRVEGVTPELLYGDLGRLWADEEGDDVSVVGDTGGAIGLRDVLTVHGFWPAIQLGAGDAGSSFAGERKINLNREWSEELGDAITKRYSADVAQGVKGLMSSGVTFKGDRDILKVLRQVGVDPREWGQTLDSFCATDEAALAGRVDVGRASEQVLAALPGLDATSAAALRSACESLEPDARMTVAWTVNSGAITPEELGACIDTIAPSSAQWRVVIEAGLLPGDEGGQDEDPPLENRLVFEAVIDLSSPKARVAELTDVTHLALTAAWRMSPGDDGGDAADEPAPGLEGDALSEAGAGPIEGEDDPVDQEQAETSRTGATGSPAAALDRRIGRFRAGSGGSL